MSITRLSDIKPAKSPKLIEVRVLKRWTPYVSNEKRKPDLWFLFVDIHGDAIEAMCPFKDIDHFSRLIEVQKCYRINDYVTRPARSYMPMVPHEASLKLGMRASVEPIENNNIPTYYYNLADYNELRDRKKDPKPLTDFIGKVIDVTPIMIRQQRRLKKIIIRDVMNNPLEITLWEEKANLIQREGAIGKAVVVTATTVSEYNVMQLKSTVSTTVELNPNFPELQSYIDRFNNLEDVEEDDPTLRCLTISQLAERSLSDELRRGHFRCNATIIAIQEHRGWFYVNCGNCGRRADPEEEGFVCDACVMKKDPVFTYSVHTIIKDDTSTIQATFFTDSMNSILGIT